MGSIFAKKNNSNQNRQTVTENYPFDPNLLPAIRDLLPKLRGEKKQIAYADYLARKIKRNPRDLLFHVQRIYLNYVLGNEEAYFGALIDLFIVLGPKALDLKKSVLRPTYRLLTTEHKKYIKEHLKTGVDAAELIPTRESRLSRGLSSTTNIVTGEPAEAKLSPLATARKKLAVGETEAARTILENALEQDPGDLEIAYELLEIYRTHSLQQEFRAMTTRLAGKSLAARKEWNETEDFFRN